MNSLFTLFLLLSLFPRIEWLRFSPAHSILHCILNFWVSISWLDAYFLFHCAVAGFASFDCPEAHRYVVYQRCVSQPKQDAVSPAPLPSLPSPPSLPSRPSLRSCLSRRSRPSPPSSPVSSYRFFTPPSSPRPRLKRQVHWREPLILSYHSYPRAVYAAEDSSPPPPQVSYIPDPLAAPLPCPSLIPWDEYPELRTFSAPSSIAGSDGSEDSSLFDESPLEDSSDSASVAESDSSEASSLFDEFPLDSSDSASDPSPSSDSDGSSSGEYEPSLADALPETHRWELGRGGRLTRISFVPTYQQISTRKKTLHLRTWVMSPEFLPTPDRDTGKRPPKEDFDWSLWEDWSHRD
ncbi:hypothetical protein EDC01DRAFT_676276 [Geopyxis carbonaria]|nr:hypothetical protein EDC01DRAFT_676276 [Geopyxis carbonaria]